MIPIRIIIFVFVFTLSLHSCRESKDQQNDISVHFEMKWEGKLSTVHRDGDSSPCIHLKDFSDSTNFYALGPLAGLRGEITILNCVPSIARINGETIQINHDFDVEAPFLVYARVSHWKSVPIDQSVQSLPDLDQWLFSAAKDIGITDRTEAFPFKITTAQSEIDFHIISNQEPGYKISKPHHELMKFFELKSKPVTLIGFFSKSHAGVFTHHGQWTHIHVVSQDGKKSGHVDSLVLGSDAVLYLPEIQ